MSLGRRYVKRYFAVQHKIHLAGKYLGFQQRVPETGAMPGFPATVRMLRYDQGSRTAKRAPVSGALTPSR